MKTTIYFVRHAQPDFSIKEDLIRPLTEKGLEDRRKVTAVLLDKNVTTIYSSPYKRSIDTVQDFADRMGFEVFTHPDFRERKVGTWVEDFEAYARNQWEDMNFKLNEGESLREVQERNISALFEVVKNHTGENIVIGTHGTALSTIVRHFNPNFGFYDFWKIADKMPYVLCFRFKGLALETIEEIDII